MNRRQTKQAFAALDALTDKFEQRAMDRIQPTVEGEQTFDGDDSPGLNFAQRLQFKNVLLLAQKAGKLRGDMPNLKEVSYSQACQIFGALGLQSLPADSKQKRWMAAQEEAGR